MDSNPSGASIPQDAAAPILALAVGHNDFPPRLDIGLDESVAVGNSLRLQAAGDAAFMYKIFDQLHVITGGEATNKQAVIPGLSAITAPAQTFFRARIENGTTTSPWSNIAKHGDFVPPVITSIADPVYAEGVQLNHQLTANKPVQWSIRGGADASRFVIRDSMLRLGGNADLDHEAKPVFAVKVRATDQAGNAADQAIRIMVSNLDEQADSFAFAAITDAPPGNPFTSNTVTISGLAPGVSVPVTATGGMLSKNGAVVGAKAVRVANGDRIAVTVNSAVGFDTIARVGVRVGSGKESTVANFNVTTLADPLSVQWAPTLSPPPVQNFPNGASTATFSKVNFGAGIAVVMVNLSGGKTHALPAMTIGGVAANVISSIAEDSATAICLLPNVAAGSHDVVVTVDGGKFLFAGIATGTLKNAKTIPAGQQTANSLKHPPMLESVVVPPNGVALVAFGSSIGNLTPVWSPVEPDTTSQFFDPAPWTHGFLLSTAHLRSSGKILIDIVPNNTAPFQFNSNAFVAVVLEPLT